MTPREAKALLIKQIRRKIIDALNHVHGMQALSFESLAYIMSDVEEGYLRSDLVYLSQKGYIECVNARPNQAFGSKEFSLTFTGKEIADAINRDPALEP